MKKIISLLLVCCFVLAAFIGCAKKPNDKPGDETTVPQGSGEETTAEPAEKHFYDDLDYDGADFKIACRGGAYENYVVGTEGGDAVWGSIYDTNGRVKTALNLNAEYVFGATDQSTFIKNAINESTTDGVYDLIMPDQYYGTTYAAEGAYRNVLRLDEQKSYLDLNTPCWYKEYLDNITLGKDSLFFVGGDLSPTILAWSSCSFVNINLYEDVFGDIDPFLTDVEEGKWTVDMLMEKCKTVYLDLDQDDRCTLDDRIGACTSSGQSAVFALVAAGMRFVDKNAQDGSLEFVIASERNDKIAELLSKLYADTTGFVTYEFSSRPNGNKETFADGRALFMNEYFLYALDGIIREMEDEYVIIPRPKADEQEASYHTSMQDSFFLYAIPTTITEERAMTATAYLQTACELFGEYVIPSFYETTLKTKYVSDKIDFERAGRLVDMVKDSITSDIAVVYTASLNKLPDVVGNLIQGKSGRSLSSMIAMQIAPFRIALETLEQKLTEHS